MWVVVDWYLTCGLGRDDELFEYSLNRGGGGFFPLGLVSIVGNPSGSGYVWLGLALGVGLLSKYSFAFVLVPMVIGDLTTQDLRARFCAPQILISIVDIVVMITLH